MTQDTGERELILLPHPGMHSEWESWGEALIAQLQAKLLQMETALDLPSFYDEQQRQILGPQGIIAYDAAGAPIDFASLVPIGAILQWSGEVATIPQGWTLCDGTNGTPDLRNSFIVAAGDAYGPGDVGGQDVVTAPPNHTHGYADGDTTYTAATVDVASGTGTTVVQALVAGGGDTARATDPTGDAFVDNRPQFYALAFIMKL